MFGLLAAKGEQERQEAMASIPAGERSDRRREAVAPLVHAAIRRQDGLHQLYRQCSDDEESDFAPQQPSPDPGERRRRKGRRSLEEKTKKDLLFRLRNEFTHKAIVRGRPPAKRMAPGSRKLMSTTFWQTRQKVRSPRCTFFTENKWYPEHRPRSSRERKLSASWRDETKHRSGLGGAYRGLGSKRAVGDGVCRG